MIITILKRYDENGAWTHDFKAEFGAVTDDQLEKSMYRVFETIDIEELRDNAQTLEEECENLTEQNRLLTLRIEELIK